MPHLSIESTSGIQPHAKQSTTHKNVDNEVKNIQHQTIFTYVNSQEISFSLACSKLEDCKSIDIEAPSPTPHMQIRGLRRHGMWAVQCTHQRATYLEVLTTRHTMFPHLHALSYNR